MGTDMLRIDPIFKWAGGKRWLVTSYSNLLPDNSQYVRYIEPFLGGGAVFFHLKPPNALLSDINQELITTYAAIRDNWQAVFSRLYDFHLAHSNKTYYAIRNKVPQSKYNIAARCIYLNRTCWNGLYRVNRQGRFNVPVGTKTSVIYETDDFGLIAKLLAPCRLEICDFEPIINEAEQGDFVYVDPPYTAKHNNNGFLKYNNRIFSWEDQRRLRDCLFRAKAKGAKILMSNANDRSIRDLYKGLGIFIEVERASRLSGDASKRRRTTELLVKSWT